MRLNRTITFFMEDEFIYAAFKEDDNETTFFVPYNVDLPYIVIRWLDLGILPDWPKKETKSE